jgi:hypothetical protein
MYKPMQSIFPIVLLPIIAYIAAETAYLAAAASLYKYAKQKYPAKLDLFASLSTPALINSFFSSRPPVNSRSALTFRYLKTLRNTVEADPSLRGDSFLRGRFRALQVLGGIELAAIIILIVVLIAAILC